MDFAAKAIRSRSRQADQRRVRQAPRWKRRSVRSTETGAPASMELMVHSFAFHEGATTFSLARVEPTTAIQPQRRAPGDGVFLWVNLEISISLLEIIRMRLGNRSTPRKGGGLTRRHRSRACAVPAGLTCELPSGIIYKIQYIALRLTARQSNPTGRPKLDRPVRPKLWLDKPTQPATRTSRDASDDICKNQ